MVRWLNHSFPAGDMPVSKGSLPAVMHVLTVVSGDRFRMENQIKQQLTPAGESVNNRNN
jgi:hypothetical protein